MGLFLNVLAGWFGNFECLVNTPMMNSLSSEGLMTFGLEWLGLCYRFLRLRAYASVFGMMIGTGFGFDCCLTGLVFYALA